MATPSYQAKFSWGSVFRFTTEKGVTGYVGRLSTLLCESLITTAALSFSLTLTAQADSE